MLTEREKEICDLKFSEVLEKFFDGKELTNKIERPTFFILSGTPGSGKTKLRETLFISRDLEKSTILINTDDLRPFHPNYEKYLIQDPIAAPLKANAVATELSNRLQREAIKQGYNIFLDTSFGKSYDESRGLLLKYKEAGYRIEMHSLVVTPDISLLGNYLRYLNGFEKGGHECLVGIDTMIKYANAIPKNLERMSKDTGICDDLCLYIRYVYRDEFGRPQNNKIISADNRDWKTTNNEERVMAIRNRPFNEVEIELYRGRYQSAENMVEKHNDKIPAQIKKEYYNELGGLRQRLGLNKERQSVQDEGMKM